MAAGALLLTATVVGIAPRVWSTANAHEEVPVVLPEFEALAQRTYVYDVNGQEIAFYELENSSPALALKKGLSIEHVIRTFHFEVPRKDLDRIARSALCVGLVEIEGALL